MAVFTDSRAIPFLTSHDTWFWLQVVRREFQAANPKFPNFSVNAALGYGNLMTSIVPRYMGNLFKRSVSCYFTWPLNRLEWYEACASEEFKSVHQFGTDDNKVFWSAGYPVVDGIMLHKCLVRYFQNMFTVQCAVGGRIDVIAPLALPLGEKGSSPPTVLSTKSWTNTGRRHMVVTSNRNKNNISHIS